MQNHRTSGADRVTPLLVWRRLLFMRRPHPTILTRRFHAAIAIDVFVKRGCGNTERFGQVGSVCFPVSQRHTQNGNTDLTRSLTFAASGTRGSNTGSGAQFIDRRNKEHEIAAQPVEHPDY